ncbi:RING finger and CHY zinc finger domain-containing protein 1 isoform 1-T2 [Amazona ochrocephala]
MAAAGDKGCEHYRRGCLLRAPCCGKLYACRLCHDGAEEHQLDRFCVSEVKCTRCRLLQKAQQRCEGCDNLFGEYYCGICHLFDSDKKQYHCPECGICRIGPKEDFFHCSKCNLCLSLSLRGKHKCIENVSRQDCPICLEDIHTSRVGAHVLPCGHLLHRTCYEDMLREGYRCPLCMHSALDMTRYWRQLDDEVAHTPMPTEYQNVMVEGGVGTYILLYLNTGNRIMITTQPIQAIKGLETETHNSCYSIHEAMSANRRLQVSNMVSLNLHSFSGGGQQKEHLS